MPRISTHLHFGKLLLESSDDEVDIRSFIFGIIAPDTFTNDEEFQKLHYLDEDGDIDVKEFYKKFNLNKLNLEQKSFIIGYYSHLWLDEYCKFNASKLTVHNKNNLLDEELGHAVKNLLFYYDNKVINGFYDNIKNDIENYKFKLSIDEFKKIKVEMIKDLLIKSLNNKSLEKQQNDLILEEEYLSFIYDSCDKFLNSIN